MGDQQGKQNKWGEKMYGESLHGVVDVMICIWNGIGYGRSTSTFEKVSWIAGRLLRKYIHVFFFGLLLITAQFKMCASWNNLGKLMV